MPVTRTFQLVQVYARRECVFRAPRLTASTVYELVGKTPGGTPLCIDHLGLAVAGQTIPAVA